MKTQDRLVKMIRETESLARGTLHVKGVSKSGRRFYNLMYRRKTKLFSRHVGVGELPRYEEATTACSKLRELFECYIDELTEKTICRIEKEVRGCRDRKS